MISASASIPRRAFFYEQVTGVKVCSSDFSFIEAFVPCSWFWLRRMLLSTGPLYALWMSCLGESSVPVGVREERVDAAISRSASKTKTRSQSSEHGVAATGDHGHLSGSICVEEVNTALVWSRCDGAGLPACVLPQRRPCSWPACHAGGPDEGPL